MKKSKKSKKEIDKEIENDSSLQGDIAMEFVKLLRKFGKNEDDQSYVAYMVFCLSGSGLIDVLGIDRFNEIVSEIKEKK